MASYSSGLNIVKPEGYFRETLRRHPKFSIRLPIARIVGPREDRQNKSIEGQSRFQLKARR